MFNGYSLSKDIMSLILYMMWLLSSVLQKERDLLEQHNIRLRRPPEWLATFLYLGGCVVSFP
jgi:hypothetical protein